MKPIDLETARYLIDYTGGDSSLDNLADIQITGAVALQNMIVDHDIGFAYLADEVGMGKTYVALGVVAMLRYFNPMLRVLYICPSRNVQEKWEREYKSFIRHNVQVNQGRIRTREGRPAAPYTSCRNVIDLLHDAASGYYADYFIRKDSFSISLSDDKSVWTRKLKELKSIIPAHEWNGVVRKKDDVKEQYAHALNYILPTFDLVVIDEAHNFKHDFESSDRNKVLSGVLGFREDESFIPRVKNALLLSATPYDRNLTQLRNQLKMVGRENLFPEGIDDDNQNIVREHLRRFMVRRLNTLSINDVEMTRNMYRREWRKGHKAEISLETDEQKLVTALIQKKVGEVLKTQKESPSFQTGLLASFESFAESTKSPPVEFDGDRIEKQQTDASDRHVIGHISDNYIKHGLGRMLPHPKMDSVVKRLSQFIFNEARKQLVFVRRVKSVSEIKNKLDDAYNEWVKSYIDNILSSHDVQKRMLNNVYQSYLQASKKRDDSVLGGETELDGDEENESIPAKNDTFFAWFFRGETLKEVSLLLTVDTDDYPTPDSLRKGLAAKNQVIVNLMEPNWSWYICKREGLSLNNILTTHGNEIATSAASYISGRLDNDHYENYQSCQIAFIECLIDQYGMEYLKPLLTHLVTAYPCQSQPTQTVSVQKLHNQLNMVTFYTELESVELARKIIPYQEKLYDSLHESVAKDLLAKDFKLFDIHKALLSFLLRTGHGVIDVYLARIQQGSGNLTTKSRQRWIKTLVALLKAQSLSKSFSTYHELSELAENLELIIKNNLPDILEKNQDEYPTFIRISLNPVSPIIGASGGTSGRSSQARKFRMPGYPLALISTDVFQEGEDLHTFCDSVVHYGMSASPVALEQKTGRVDRVNSMAQRRLVKLKNGVEDDDYIQVTFPYVKESIELLQIRQTCKNLNAFIESLHDISTSEHSANDTVDIDAELLSREEVPDQILDKLESPYKPVVSQRNKHHAIRIIDSNESCRNKEIDHVNRLLTNYKNGCVNNLSTILYDDDCDIPESTMAVKLSSAKASGELLLSLTRHADPSTYQISDRKELFALMNKLSWRTFHRTYSIACPDIKDCYQLFFNAEMLVGGADITQHAEIERLFERMEIEHDPKSYDKNLSDTINEFVESINDTTMISIDRSGNTKISIKEEKGHLLLEFVFGESSVHRIQRVSLYECDDRCVFISKVTRSGYCKKLSVKDIIKYTWRRNRNIDLVEFVVDSSFSIVGRVVHPVEFMQFEEFIHCAYTLAVEADNLEYLLSKKDVH